MSRLKAGTALTRLLAAGLVAAVVAAAVIVLVSTSSKTGVAYFESVKSIYPNDRVKIQGVDVGKISSIEPAGDKVRMEFTYDSQYDLPAEVNAAVVSPTLVATRFLQLAPAYTGGPVLEDGAEIPVERTVSPLEFDDLKKELQNLSTALGPDEANQSGSLSRFLDMAARNAAGGQGQKFNELVREASSAVETLSEGRGDLFGTVRNLQAFVTALKQVDGQIVEFNSRLDTVSGVLTDNEDELSRALEGVSRAAVAVDEFVADNGPVLNESVTELGDLTRTLSNSRDELATILHVGPSTLMNLFNIVSPRTRALSGKLVVDNLNTPADFVCSAFTAAAQDPIKGIDYCKSNLGPLFNLLRVQQPPVGVNPIAVPGTGGPTDNQPGRDAPYRQPTPGPEAPPDVDAPGLGGLLFPQGGN
ncbi:MCE-family protein Mce1D [Pseudonocardia sp. Ae168_Ps1]|uniref:MCE family protein n=1 Tax=unclassified Pseudonocardia TaxID=2619320 RepID=UPI0007611F2D|nr:MULTISPECIES: MCE family protein [unclassified Pseudonocardia]OLL76006.1 MCE-family protein Mce1D [Pseudonocardia sp. Ae150A_Ps1]OLL82004.1 MCE-family protein Mce1D [Pseudonocardia sp. Ae168_Ps1]OLL83882.1 MCE-family protein Mce1D [Pseudonocardia sp. Ae263_Ps1]OLL96099.1 MCE-family protein Mce1D [Pseudonocardia sp. Ae356_Ps1]